MKHLQFYHANLQTRKLRFRGVKYNFAQVRKVWIGRAEIYSLCDFNTAPAYKIVFIISHQCIKKVPPFPLESKL